MTAHGNSEQRGGQHDEPAEAARPAPSRAQQRSVHAVFAGRPAAAHQLLDALADPDPAAVQDDRSKGYAAAAAALAELVAPYAAACPPMPENTLRVQMIDAGVAGQLREMSPVPARVGATGQRHVGLGLDHRPVSVHVRRPGAASALEAQLAGALRGSRRLGRAFAPVPVAEILGRLLAQAPGLADGVATARRQHALRELLDANAASADAPRGWRVAPVLFAAGDVTITEHAEGVPVTQARALSRAARTKASQEWLELTVLVLRHGLSLSGGAGQGLLADEEGHLSVVDVRGLVATPTSLAPAVEHLVWAATHADAAAAQTALRTCGAAPTPASLMAETLARSGALLEQVSAEQLSRAAAAMARAGAAAELVHLLEQGAGVLRALDVTLDATRMPGPPD